MSQSVNQSQQRMQEDLQEMSFPPAEDRGRPGQQLELIANDPNTENVRLSVAGLMEEEEDMM